ncbi:MAG: type II secretion system F family protein [Ilumatobacteraceae bacterium]|nr:type II secretion system F family protein [Ilumatobacteraceae bacterium]
MIATVLVAMLVAMIAARAGSRLRSSPRSRSPRATAHGRGSRSHSPDYASLLDGISRQVRSGSSLTSAAIDEIDRCSPLHVVLDRLEAGDSLADALATVHASHADLALTVQALSATAHLGGPIAATLDEAAAVLRERAAARAERRAHGSQARLSARVLTIVPVGFAAWSAAVSQRTRDVYISTAAGGVCAICGLALNLVGWRWMKRIIGPS